MGTNRLSISGLMGVIAVAAIGFVGLREGTETWASTTFALTAIVLLMAVPNLIYSRDAERAVWTGFALFGWAYLLFSFSTWSGENLTMPPLPTRLVLNQVHDRIHAKPQHIPNPKHSGVNENPDKWIAAHLADQPYVLKPGTTYWKGSEVHYRQVGHCLFALAFGALGALWTRFVFSFQTRRLRATVRTAELIETSRPSPGTVTGEL